MKTKCPGCRHLFDSTPDPTPPDPYIGACHRCWDVYSQILAREFSDPEYFAVHRITVDAYAAQHIGDQTDRRARQSANLHLMALYLYFDQKVEILAILGFLRRATVSKSDWPAVEDAINPSWLTVEDVIQAKTAADHCDLVKKWGQSVWMAYKPSHSQLIQRFRSL